MVLARRPQAYHSSPPRRAHIPASIVAFGRCAFISASWRSSAAATGPVTIAPARWPQSPAIPAAFVAPYDRFSREAYLEVANRFDVISTGWFEALRLPVAWWPAYAEKKVLHHAHWRHDGTTLLSHPGCLLSFHRHYDEMLATVQRAVERSPLTVLVTHWWEYFRDGQPDDRFIGVLHEVAKWLGSRPDIRVITFRDLLREEIPLN